MTDGIDELIDAAKRGDRDQVRTILSANPSLAGATAATGETALMAALYRGHSDTVADVAAAMRRAGQSLDLFAAAATGDIDAMDAALEARADVNGHAYDGWTPLHLAAFFGHREAAERLLARGADLTAVSRNSLANTPLHAAVAGGHSEVSLLLIERGAGVNSRDAGGHTPLHIAAEGGYVPVVKALLARGADPHAVDAEDRTPLARAAARNHTTIVDLINVDR